MKINVWVKTIFYFIFSSIIAVSCSRIYSVNMILNSINYLVTMQNFQLVKFAFALPDVILSVHKFMIFPYVDYSEPMYRFGWNRLKIGMFLSLHLKKCYMMWVVLKATPAKIESNLNERLYSWENALHG